MMLAAQVRLVPRLVDLRALLKQDLDHAAHDAATSPHNLKTPPTEAQAKAGNYPKGHVRFAGLDVSIENPAGSKRKPEWPTMQAHYGYIKGTEGADGDHVDVFLRPATPVDWDGTAYVIDQVGADGSFDEHKIMLGYDSQEQAEKSYLSHYPAGWKLGPVTAMSLDELKAWLEGDTTGPLKKGDVEGHEFHGNQWYHGTSEGPGAVPHNATMVMPGADKAVWLTRDKAKAEHYAQMAAQKTGNKPVVLVVEDNAAVQDPENFGDKMTRSTSSAVPISARYYPSSKIVLGGPLKKGDVEGHEFHGNQYTAINGEEGMRNYAGHKEAPEDKPHYDKGYEDGHTSYGWQKQSSGRKGSKKYEAYARGYFHGVEDSGDIYTGDLHSKINLRSLLIKEDGGASTTTTGHVQSSSATSGITAYGNSKRQRRRVKLKAKEKQA